MRASVVVIRAQFAAPRVSSPTSSRRPTVLGGGAVPYDASDDDVWRWWQMLIATFDDGDDGERHHL